METTKATHTPGPWVVRTFPTYSNALAEPWIMDSIPDAKDGHVVANAICKCSRSNPDYEANAEFIAMACNAHYDLLDACQRALDALDLADQDRFDGGELCGLLRSVIAKAQGHA